MYLGIDTSNYTTSLALFDGETALQVKKLLEVKPGERGLRQSEALFQHTVNLPELMDKLPRDRGIKAVGVSTRPRNIEGSYMPCFLAGISCAKSVSYSLGVPMYETSHQVGHILAALYSANRLDLINREFIAFHLSGGTTEALLVTPDSENIIKANLIASSNDLKAGQLIDRTGVMLGMKFPCGKELDCLAAKSDIEYKIRPSMSGLDCSLSGVENKVVKMLENNEKQEDIAKFVLSYVSASVDGMANGIIERYGNLPLLFSGGVSSNSYLRKIISNKYNSIFATPEFSCDNACGVAVYAYLKSKK